MIKWWLRNFVVIWTSETCQQCYPHLSTRSPSGTRRIIGIKVSPSRNNQCHCVTPCYQDVMLVWRRVTRSYRRAAQCDVWHSGQVRARVTWPGYTRVICHLCRHHAPAPTCYCSERRIYFCWTKYFFCRLYSQEDWQAYSLFPKSPLVSFFSA